MGRVEVIPLLEPAMDFRDPLLQDHQSRSSSEGGSSTAGGGGGASQQQQQSKPPSSNSLLGTTPTLLEETPASLSSEQVESEELTAPDTPQNSASGGEPRRLSSSVPASTSIVETLFGPGLGPCWGDFSCTYNRIRGRLYATSQAVLFYTNLLGFERRICLLLRDVFRMELFRTTSLRFSTMDDETYIFKSFNDREQVLHLLNGLKILANKHQRKEQTPTGTSATPSPALRRSSARVERGQLSPTHTNNASTVATASNNINRMSTQISFQPIPSLQPSRRRAASDSILRLPRGESPFDNGRSPPDNLEDSNSMLSDLRGGEETTVVDVEEDAPSDISMSVLWRQAKQPKSPPLDEVGIDGITLPCDLDTFFQYFWADSAEHSFEYYQREYIKDKDVALTGWDLGSDGYFRRTLQFRHPIQNSLGLGPSAADTTRSQKLRNFNGLGITLENRTIVAGIPGADSFYVQDHWVLEAMGENQVQLTVQYDTRFTKRSMFKSIISKSIRKETKEWMAGYLDMVQGVLASKASHRAVSSAAVPVSHPVPTAQSQKLIREAIMAAYRLIAVVSIAFFGLGLVACIHLYRLQQSVAQLHQDFQQMQFCQPPPSSLPE